MARKSSFTNVRKKSFDVRLDDTGFVRGTTMWTRTRGNQIHGVDLEIFRGQWTATAAFHFNFLPSLWKFEPLNPLAAHQLDFLLTARVGPLRSGTDKWWNKDASLDVLTKHYRRRCGNDEWWDTNADPESLATQLSVVADTCIAALDEQQSAWRDPQWFLDRITPEILRSERRVCKPYAGNPDGCVPTIWVLLPAWCPDLLEMSYFLAVLAERTGNRRLAQSYAAFAAEQDQTVLSSPAVKALLDAVGIPEVEVKPVWD